MLKNKFINIAMELISNLLTKQKYSFRIRQPMSYMDHLTQTSVGKELVSEQQLDPYFIPKQTVGQVWPKKMNLLVNPYNKDVSILHFRTFSTWLNNLSIQGWNFLFKSRRGYIAGRITFVWMLTYKHHLCQKTDLWWRCTKPEKKNVFEVFRCIFSSQSQFA